MTFKKQQQQESSTEQSSPPSKYITRRSQISKIIKVQGDLPSGSKIEGRRHIQKVISVRYSDDLNKLQRADQMIGGDWEVERQTPDSSNVEVGNGMGKTYQCEDNEKLGNNDQNQVNGMVGNSKSNNVDFKRIEIDQSKSNDVQENKDYVEMV